MRIGRAVLLAGILGASIAGVQARARAAPIASFSLQSVTFSPSVMVGLRSSQPQIHLTNTGDQPLDVVAVTLTGANPGDFRASGCAAVPPPLTLPPGSHCDIQVQFVPVAAGNRSATLTVVTNDKPHSPALIPLAGEGVAPGPALAVVPTSLDFGSQSPGTTSAPQEIRVVNVGVLPATVNAVAADDPTSYQVTHGCGHLDPAILVTSSSTCTIVVTFTPAGSGPRNAHLTITSATPQPPVVVSLTGRGAQPAIAASPALLAFGSLAFGNTRTLALTLTNTGATGTTLNVTATQTHGDPDFALVPGTACTGLAAGAMCQISVVFSPRASGQRSGSLVVQSDAGGGSTLTVPITGAGEFGLIGATAPPLPPADDHTFVAAGHPDSCVATGGTIPLTVGVTRAFGSVPATGSGPTLVGAVFSGAMASTASLELMVYQPGTPSQDGLVFNTSFVSAVQPPAGSWTLTTIAVPSTLLLFPGVAARNSSPTPASNQVTLTPDTWRVGSCLAVAWIRLRIKAISPVIFVHGKATDGGFFRRQGLVAALNTAGIPNDSSIDLTPSIASVATNAAALQAVIPGIVRSFGVDSVHIIAHSMGGLDVRAWLSANATGTASLPFSVLSVTTAGTPHQGSVLADLQLAVASSAIALDGIPLATIGALVPAVTDAAAADLSTQVATNFNPVLPAKVDYRMLGGNADANGDLIIESVPVDEYAPARSEISALATLFAASTTSTGAHPLADAVMTAVYHLLFTTRTVRVTTALVPLPLPLPFPVFVSISAIVPVPSLPSPNDFLVTARSATGAPSPFTSPFPVFTGDHAALGGATVGTSIVPFLVTTERARGDLR